MTGPYRTSDGKVVLTDEEYRGLVGEVFSERVVRLDAHAHARRATTCLYLVVAFLMLASLLGAEWVRWSTAHFEPDAIARSLVLLPASPPAWSPPRWPTPNPNIILVGGVDSTVANGNTAALEVNPSGHVLVHCDNCPGSRP